MGGSAESVFTLAPWSAFGKKGAFDDVTITASVAGGEIPEGAQQLTLSSFPPNMFSKVAQVDPTPDDPAVGFGHFILFDVGGADQQVIQVDPRKGVGLPDFDPALEVRLAKPLLDLDDPSNFPLAAGVALGMADSPALQIGNFPKRIAVVVTGHDEDDRGVAATTSPDVDFQLLFATRKEGPYFLDPGLVPPGVPATSGAGDVQAFTTLDLPPFPYMKVRPVVNGPDNGLTIFSFEVMRSEP